jgi:hypothetical protein
MIIDRHNRRTRKESRFFIHDVLTKRIVISLVEKKTFKDYCILFNNVKQNILPLSIACANNTYVDMSTGFVTAVNSKKIKSIGQGLFANIFLMKGTIIDYFNGVLRSAMDFEERVRLGFGGYSIHLNKDCVLDCYDSVNCKCSMANSPKGVSVDNIGTVVISNASLHVDTNRCGCVYLFADCDIKMNSEIYFDYEKSFIFPVFA